MPCLVNATPLRFFSLSIPGVVDCLSSCLTPGGPLPPLGGTSWSLDVLRAFSRFRCSIMRAAANAILTVVVYDCNGTFYGR